MSAIAETLQKQHCGVSRGCDRLGFMMGIRSCFISGFILISAGLSAAQSVAIVPTGGNAGNDSRAFVIGYEFSVSAQTTVTNLGYLDATAAGLNESHMVGIFDASDGSLLTSATVSTGAATSYVDGFRVAPVNYPLGPGTYVIGALKLTGADYAMVTSPGVTSVPGVQYIQERELLTSTFTMPTTNFTPDEAGSFGPGFTVTSPAGAPVITGLSNSGSFQPVFAPNTYISIFGSNLANTTRGWNASDFQNGNQLPTSLSGVSVTVGGAPAYVQYISPTQVNIITPNLAVMPPSGASAQPGIPLVINVPNQQPVTAWLGLQTVAPAFFTWQTGTAASGKYLVAQHADYSNVGAAGLFPNEPANFTTPAIPGETIILYGTGLGPTSPAITPGIITNQIYPLAVTPTATVGGMAAQVQFAGLIPTLSQVYQVNVTIPSGVAPGDATLVLNVNGSLSAPGLITIGQ